MVKEKRTFKKVIPKPAELRRSSRIADRGNKTNVEHVSSNVESSIHHQDIQSTSTNPSFPADIPVNSNTVQNANYCSSSDPGKYVNIPVSFNNDDNFVNNNIHQRNTNSRHFINNQTQNNQNNSSHSANPCVANQNYNFEVNPRRSETVQEISANRQSEISQINHFLYPNAIQDTSNMPHHSCNAENVNLVPIRSNANSIVVNSVHQSQCRPNDFTRMSQKSGTSRKSSASYQRQRLEVELEFARKERDLNKKVLDMERQLEITRINESRRESLSKSSTSKYESLSQTSDRHLSHGEIVNWINNCSTYLNEVHDNCGDNQRCYQSGSICNEHELTSHNLNNVYSICGNVLENRSTVMSNQHNQFLQTAERHIGKSNVSAINERHRIQHLTSINESSDTHCALYGSGTSTNNQHTSNFHELPSNPVHNHHFPGTNPAVPEHQPGQPRIQLQDEYGQFESRNQYPVTQQYESHVSDLKNWMIRQSISTDLPQFSGNPLEWYAFITQYRLSSSMCSLSSCENLLRLQKSLIGNAKKAVESLLIFPQNVDKIIQILETRFGRPENIIFMLLEKVRKLPLVQKDKINELVNFYDNLTNLVYTLDFLNQPDHIRNPILYREVLDKLPLSQRLSFIQHFDNMQVKPAPLVALHNWLGQKVNAASQLIIPTNSFHEKTSSKTFKNKGFTLAISNADPVKNSKDSDSIKRCIYCKNSNHMIFNCYSFKNLEIDKRWNFVTQNKVCFSCLSDKHNLKSCKHRKTCSFKDCEKPHHPLLHQNLPDSRAVENPKSYSDKPSSNGHTLYISNPTKTLLKIIPVQLKGPNSVVNTYALLDDASTVTLIEKEVSETLGLEGPKSDLKLKWTNNVYNEEFDSQIVSVNIKGRDSFKSYTLRFARTVDKLCLPSQSINVEALCGKYPYMNQYKMLSYENAQPTILIGQDNWPIISTRKLYSGCWEGPAVSKTLLGYTVHGNIDCDTNVGDDFSNFHVYNISSQCEESDDLKVIQDLLKSQWSYDIDGTVSKTDLYPSLDDQHCSEILNRTVARVGDRFQSGLLWKDNDTTLPESKSNAIRRLQHLERKMDKNPEFARKYIAKIDESIEKGYLRKLSVEEAQKESRKLWYLPHFGVINPNKPEKLRIVYDAAAKSHGKCLNDFLLPGIDFYNSLITIMLNFRIHKIAFVADIKEMFLQILIQENDRFAQRILWRGSDRDREYDTYEIQVLFFGACCSPCIAQEVKNKNAREFINIYPKACQDIIESHYMDDYLGGAESVNEAVELVSDVISVHKRGSFEICNWISNSPELISHIDEKLRAPKTVVKNFDEKSHIERVLGIFWNFNQDTFSFNFNFNKIDPLVLDLKRRPTKRDILKIVMSIFDPLGFISHFVIVGKILLQNIWESKISWDDEITDKQNIEWEKWQNQFSEIASISIPRILTNFALENTNTQLHIFCDASIYAYASVAYLRFENNDEIEVKLLMSKARVAPLKPMSVPRLELQAAVLASRLSNYIKSSLKIKISAIFHWSDSKTVLYWINSSSRRFKVFVAHRLVEIQELTDPKTWRYVPTKINISDDATKLKKLDFSINSCWFTGPKFLYNSIAEWPQGSFENVDIDEVEEVKTAFLATISVSCTSELPEVSRFSKFNRFLRATAWMLRAVEIRFNKSNNKQKELLPYEISKAEILIFKKIQFDSYARELDCLRKQTPLPKSSSLYSLRIFLDDNNIIRLTGRLTKSNDINYDSKHPILLSFRHPISKLMISNYHEQLNHIGTETVIAEIRKRFWITNLRNAVKHAAYDCQLCKNLKSKPKIPIMGQLPSARIDVCVRPFIKTGVDLFGPIDVLVNRSKIKRYGVIFTCMAMRAVHLEIVEDLSTNSFIHVLRQFGARRGFPEYLFSDRGSNFIGASKELSDAYSMLESEKITQFCTMKRCEWIFNPPSSPHMGGVWERLIKTIKKHLSFVLKSKCPKEFVLRTLFYEIEQIINSRPITYNSSDPDDLKVLTPNDLLIGSASTCYQPAMTNDKDLCVLSQWRAVQRLSDVFWQRWIREYIPNLLYSRKWYEENANIQLNDVVLIVDPTMPRNVWPKGKVIQVFPATDGRVRVVDVQTNTGVYKRPVSKIVKLDVLKKSNSF